MGKAKHHNDLSSQTLLVKAMFEKRDDLFLKMAWQNPLTIRALTELSIPNVALENVKDAIASLAADRGIDLEKTTNTKGSD